MSKAQNKKWLWLMCLLSVILMGIALICTGRTNEAMEFVPPAFEENALPGIPQVPDGLGWGQVDAVVFQAWVCGSVTITDGKADIWLTNPSESTVWLKVRVLDGQGNILGQTGLLRPGEYVQSVSLDPPPEPGVSISLKLMAYEPDSYFSAGSVILNTRVAD